MLANIKIQPRVCMLVPFLHHFGGMEKQSWRLAQEYKALGIDVFFISGIRFFELFDKRYLKQLKEKKPGIKVYRFVGIFAFNNILPLGLIFYWLIFLLFSCRRYNIIHAHQLFTAGLAACLAKKILPRKKVVIKAVGSGAFGDIKDIVSNPFKKLKLKLLKTADKIIAINPEIKTELLRLGFSNEQIIEIPNGIKVTNHQSRENKDQLKQQLEIQAQQLLVSIGRIVPQKQTHILIQAFAQVLREFPQSKLYLLGIPDLTTNYGQEVQAITKKLGLESKVIFYGLSNEVEKFLRAADIFVLASASEGISNALLEAAACSCPIVTTDVVGNRQVIQDQQSGLLARSKDHRDLANKIVYLLKNPQRAEKFGQEAKRKVAKNFSLEVIAEKYYQLYQQLLTR